MGELSLWEGPIERVGLHTGLPYAATESQIREFFAGYVIKALHFVFEPDGRPSGLVSSEGHKLIFSLPLIRSQH